MRQVTDYTPDELRKIADYIKENNIPDKIGYLMSDIINLDNTDCLHDNHGFCTKDYLIENLKYLEVIVKEGSKFYYDLGSGWYCDDEKKCDYGLQYLDYEWQERYLYNVHDVDIDKYIEENILKG